MKGMFPNIRLAFFALFLAMLALAVSASASSYPVIDDISIYPSSPNKYDDLTCSVSVTDTDGNLDYVKFEWYVNGVLKRQSNKLVYGTSDNAEDILSSWYTEASDYVVCKAWAYDFDGYFDYKTHAVHVGRQNQNKPPSSSYVEITPRHPNPQQDLTCSILAIDMDDNLDYVTFEWYVNSNKVRTGTRNLYGSSDNAQDTLSSYYTHSYDSVTCRVTVVDTLGASSSKYSLPVYIGSDGGGSGGGGYYPNKKPIAVLTTGTTYVSVGDYVYFSGVASHDPDGFVIQYYFDFGDGLHSPWLPQSSPYTYHSYSSPGTYYAKLKVKDNEYLESDWSGGVAIHVHENGGYPPYDHYPRVDSIRIEPEHPDEYDDLTCETRVSDSDGDLDYVRFQWYVDSRLVRTRTVNVYGSSDEADDILDEDNFDEGDRVECKATVFDRRDHTDTDHDVVTIGDNGYYDEDPEIRSIRIEPDDPDVYDDLTCEVRVEDDDGDLDYVWFQWFVDDEEVREVRKNVYGYDDEVSFELDSRYYDYKDMVKCKATVYDEERNRDSDYDIIRIGDYPYPSRYCGHSIETFDYSSYVLEGNKAWVEVRVRNTGLRSNTLTMNLFADNSMKDTHTAYLVYGREITKKFEFNLPLGSHEIKLESYLACGSPLSKQASIIVYKSGGTVTKPPEPPEEPPEITETFVSITPTHLDIEIYKGKTLEILIESPEEANFEIEVLDLPDNWANYPKQVTVDGRERVYAYIVPKQLGEYTFRVNVKAGDETFQETIDLYVAPEGELEEEGFDGLTGLITAGGGWIAGLVMLIVIIVIVVLYFGYKKSRKKTYVQHVYGERRYPSETGMMKGSVGSVSPAKNTVDIDRLIPAEIERYSDLSYFPRQGKDFSNSQSEGKVFR